MNMENKYEIAKPLFDWYDDWCDYETTKIDNENVHIKDLQLGEEYDMSIVDRVDGIGDYIYDSFQDHRDFGEESSLYVDNITKRYEETREKLGLEKHYLKEI